MQIVGKIPVFHQFLTTNTPITFDLKKLQKQPAKQFFTNTCSYFLGDSFLWSSIFLFKWCVLISRKPVYSYLSPKIWYFFMENVFWNLGETFYLQRLVECLIISLKDAFWSLLGLLETQIQKSFTIPLSHFFSEHIKFSSSNTCSEHLLKKIASSAAFVFHFLHSRFRDMP